MQKLAVLNGLRLPRRRDSANARSRQIRQSCAKLLPMHFTEGNKPMTASYVVFWHNLDMFFPLASTKVSPYHSAHILSYKRNSAMFPCQLHWNQAARPCQRNICSDFITCMAEVRGLTWGATFWLRRYLQNMRRSCCMLLSEQTYQTKCIDHRGFIVLLSKMGIFIFNQVPFHENFDTVYLSKNPGDLSAFLCIHQNSISWVWGWEGSS